MRLAIAGDNTLARIYALGYLGLVRVEQGDADAARASVAQALELAAEPAAPAHFVTAMALLAHGRLDGRRRRARGGGQRSLAAARRLSRSRRHCSASASTVATRPRLPKPAARSPPARIPAGFRS